jgi:hypothetical protein
MKNKNITRILINNSKILILSTLFISLFITCREDTKEKVEIEKVEIEKFGEIIKGPTVERRGIDRDVYCCVENNFYLINNSFNKKIRFTLQKEYYNHYHTQFYIGLNCDNIECGYTNEEKEKMKLEKDTSLQTHERELDTKNIFMTLSPGEKLLLKNREDGDAYASCMCGSNFYTPNYVKNYIVVGELDIVDEKEEKSE